MNDNNSHYTLFDAKTNRRLLILCVIHVLLFSTLTIVENLSSNQSTSKETENSHERQQNSRYVKHQGERHLARMPKEGGPKDKIHESRPGVEPEPIVMISFENDEASTDQNIQDEMDTNEDVSDSQNDMNEDVSDSNNVEEDKAGAVHETVATSEKDSNAKLFDSFSGNTGAVKSQTVTYGKILLTYLVHNPHERHRALAPSSLPVAMDPSELTKLTRKHLLFELEHFLNEDGDIQDTSLLMTPVQAGKADPSSTIVHISQAIEGDVVFSLQKIKRDGLVLENELQQMIYKAFDGDALERYIILLQIFATDLVIKNVQGVYLGPPLNRENSSGMNAPQNSNTKFNWNIVWVGVVIGVCVCVVMTFFVLYLWRKNVALIHQTSTMTTKSRDNSADHTDKSDGQKGFDIIDLTRVNSSQLSDAMSVYVESNIVVDEHSCSMGTFGSSSMISEIKVPINGDQSYRLSEWCKRYRFEECTQPPMHASPQRDFEVSDDENEPSPICAQDSSENAVENVEDHVERAPVAEKETPAEHRCEQVRLAAEAELDRAISAIFIDDANSSQSPPNNLKVNIEDSSRSCDKEIADNEADPKIQDPNASVENQKAEMPPNFDTQLNEGKYVGSPESRLENNDDDACLCPDDDTCESRLFAGPSMFSTNKPDSILMISSTKS